ncbi:tyrosyl-DNA phosphodiesterase 1-like [Zophobas morio]|uniref:tyrosyl-DNA phosphodiesterase 1-like n=1 Tax=Zophobas morio TaxID=2755281 RepID=UPI003083C35F
MMEYKMLVKFPLAVKENNVHLIASVPGKFTSSEAKHWGHMKARYLLNSLPQTEMDSPSLYFQFSSLGSVQERWLLEEFKKSLEGANDNIDLKIIFPTVENVRESNCGYASGGSLPYSWKNEMRQRYLYKYFCSWNAEVSGRNKVLPHIKTYMKFFEAGKHISWVILTSANLSKSAWGCFNKQNEFIIRSYEIGVLFHHADNPEKSFFQQNLQENNLTNLPIPYDIPAKPYSKADKVWIWDNTYKKKDHLGNKWPN